MDMDLGFDSLCLLEHARRLAEATYKSNPRDVDNLIRWGSALVDISQFQSSVEGVKCLKEAVSKLEEALKLNPKKPDAWWCLGNAHTVRAYFTPDFNTAMVFFDKATKCYKKAFDEAPSNIQYRKSLEAAPKAPDSHMERRKQKAIQTAQTAASFASGSKTSKKSEKYVFLGWVLLSVSVIAWVESAKRRNPM